MPERSSSSVALRSTVPILASKSDWPGIQPARFEGTVHNTTGTPAARGVGEVVERAMRRGLPLFGVCLGHQGIAEYFGAKLGVQEVPRHGKPSPIHHQGTSIFTGLPSPINAGRYHSLYVIRESLPPELEVVAETEQGMVMALRHKTLPIASFQFHPESILTLEQEIGQRMIENMFTRFLAQHLPVQVAAKAGA